MSDLFKIFWKVPLISSCLNIYKFTNQEWNIGLDNIYFSSLYGGCVMDQGYNLLTYIRESKRIDNSGVEYSK